MKSLINYINENVTKGTLRDLRSGDTLYISKLGTDDAYKITVADQFYIDEKIYLKFKENKTGIIFADVTCNKNMKNEESFTAAFFDNNSEMWFIGTSLEEVKDSHLEINKGKIKKLEDERKKFMDKVESIDKEIAELTEKASTKQMIEK